MSCQSGAGPRGGTVEVIAVMLRREIDSGRADLINDCYPVAVDGTQKMVRGWLWNGECLQRTFNRGEDGEKTLYYVYVLQANLAFAGGMSIPLMSEFPCQSEGDSEKNKQDCEVNAFYRLAARLKEEFPALRILLLLDGLYAKGPVMELCSGNKWQYMIVLKDDGLPSVMQEEKTIVTTPGEGIGSP